MRVELYIRSGEIDNGGVIRDIHIYIVLLYILRCARNMVLNVGPRTSPNSRPGPNLDLVRSLSYNNSYNNNRIYLYCAKIHYFEK